MDKTLSKKNFYRSKNKLPAFFLAAVLLFGAPAAVCPSPRFSDAEEISGRKLQYFKLEKPLDVYRSGEEVYIAQKDLVVIYSDDTYRTVDFSDITKADGESAEKSLSAIERCGNALLVSCGSDLYSLDLATLTVSAAPIVSNVTAFSVLEDRFVASVNEDGANKVRFFACIPENPSQYTEFTPSRVSLSLSGETAPCAIAYASSDASGDGTTYYYASGNLRRTEDTLTREYPEFAPLALGYSDGLLYMRVKDSSGDTIYSFDPQTETRKTVLSLDKFVADGDESHAEGNLSGANGFSVQNGKMLVCDTERDRVIEFNLASGSATITDYEISFTKIDLPTDFGFTLDASPEYVSIPDNAQLYNVDLAGSLKAGYFVFNGMYRASNDSDGNSEYLIEATVGTDYYLVSGKCTALVLKSDYDAIPVPEQTPTETEFVFANDSTVYKTVYKTANKTTKPNRDDDAEFFAAFKVKKGDEATVLKLYTLRGTTFAYVRAGENSGYIPLACLTNPAPAPGEKKDFKTATTARKKIVVYSDETLETVTDELPACTEIIVYSEKDGVCYVSYADEKFGYIKSSDIAKKGEYTKKVVAAVILLTLSLCLTTIFFERKFLYGEKEKEKAD